MAKRAGARLWARPLRDRLWHRRVVLREPVRRTVGVVNLDLCELFVATRDCDGLVGIRTRQTLWRNRVGPFRLIRRNRNRRKQTKHQDSGNSLQGTLPKLQSPGIRIERYFRYNSSTSETCRNFDSRRARLSL